MRAHAKGLLCAVAAVELLIGHAAWLRRNDFVDRFVDAGECLAGGTVLANLFLHYAFDAWMAREYPTVQFERYADDGVPRTLKEVPM